MFSGPSVNIKVSVRGVSIKMSSTPVFIVQKRIMFGKLILAQ